MLADVGLWMGDRQSWRVSSVPRKIHKAGGSDVICSSLTVITVNQKPESDNQFLPRGIIQLLGSGGQTSSRYM